jgi:hypothetical protein
MLTDKEIGDYLTYRFKLNELIHLHFLFHALNDGNCGESINGIPKDQVLMSVRTAAVAWFATMMDTHRDGLDIFKLWLKMYPQYQNRINLYHSLVDPHLKLIRTFRNRTAFHAQSGFVDFFEPRVRFQEKAKDIARGVQKFLDLAKFLIKRERQCEPNFYSRILGAVLDAELQLKRKISRRWLIEANIIDRSSVYGIFHF